MLSKWGKLFYALLRCSLRRNSSSLLAHTPNVRCINKNWLCTPSSVLFRDFFLLLFRTLDFFSYFSVFVTHEKSEGNALIPKLEKCPYLFFDTFVMAVWEY